MEDEIKTDSCIFCSIPKDRILKKFNYFYVIEDAFPVTEMHTLIISNRHISNYFDLSKEEKDELPPILEELKNLLLKRDASIEGFNIGINIGEAAGQTVMHFHQHLIPRRAGDVDNPRGGVRGVIPAKQQY